MQTAAALRNLRLHLGVSARQAALNAGMKPMSASQYESGTRGITAEKAERYIRAMHKVAKVKVPAHFELERYRPL